MPDGIPSPAATLALQAPWQGIADPAAGNANLRDITYQVEPWLLFLRHEMRAGRLPFWDPHQFSGSPYWSNGSGAPLFPLHLLFAVLPLQLGLVLLPWLRIVIGGCGAWLLARELGVSRPAALLAALIFPLSGMITSFLLFPMGNCHALVPWVLLAVERLANGRGSWIGLAVAGGLQLLGGHPETPVFTALLAGVYLLARGSAARSRPGASSWPAGSWRERSPPSTSFPSTRRSPGAGSGCPRTPGPRPSPLGTIAAVLLRAVLPDIFGNPAAGTWWGPFNYAATAIYAGALTLPFAAAGLAAARGDRRWRAVAVMTLFALVAAYHLFGMRQVLILLPVIQRGLHHYMKFGLELGLALLAAAGCDRWLAGRGRGVLAGSALVLALLAVAWLWLGGEWREHGLLGTEIAWMAWIALLAGSSPSRSSCPRSRRWTVWLLLPGLLTVDLVAAHGRTNPGLSNGKLYPVTGAVRFLQGRPERVAGLGTPSFPTPPWSTASTTSAATARSSSSATTRSTPTWAPAIPSTSSRSATGAAPGSTAWGCAGWYGPREEAPPGMRWRLAYAGPDARVYERPGALPWPDWKAGQGGSRRGCRGGGGSPGRPLSAPAGRGGDLGPRLAGHERRPAGGRRAAPRHPHGGAGGPRLRVRRVAVPSRRLRPGDGLSALGLCLLAAGAVARRAGRPESRPV